MAKERYTMRDFAQKHNFQLEKHGCSGSYGGYRVHIRYRLLGNPSCLLTVVTHTAGKNKELEKYLERHKKELKLSAYGVVGIGLMVCPQLYSDVFRKLEEILDKIVGYLQKNGFPNEDLCPYCGKELGADRTEMLESGIPFAAHEACFERAFTAARQKEAAESARSDRRLRGMLGAVLAGVTAAAAFAIMFLWWGFGAIAALIGSMFGGWLYGKFGGKNTPFRIAFVFFSTLVLLLATYAVCLYLQAPVADSVGGVVAGIAGRLRTDVGFRVLFILNLVILVALDGVGTVYNIFSYRRDRARVYSLVRRA